MFKLFLLTPLIVSLAGTTVAAPFAINAVLVARKFRKHGASASAVNIPTLASVASAPAAAAAVATSAAGATVATPCAQDSNDTGSISPDDNLPLCSDLKSPATPAPCTFIQAEATDFGTALCPPVVATAAPPGTTPCGANVNNFNFATGASPDSVLPVCGFFEPSFLCTFIQAVTDTEGTPPCNGPPATAAA
ncbi:hypothetical protein K438DRAFT_1985054 [Mycena galopus ATCC 62051]|nr:hypothetical protein K438DRAFT_1985054 [Mycena galopus ATCC 62051]